MPNNIIQCQITMECIKNHSLTFVKTGTNCLPTTNRHTSTHTGKTFPLISAFDISRMGIMLTQVTFSAS